MKQLFLVEENDGGGGSSSEASSQWIPRKHRAINHLSASITEVDWTYMIHRRVLENPVACTTWEKMITTKLHQ